MSLMLDVIIRITNQDRIQQNINLKSQNDNFSQTDDLKQNIESLKATSEILES